MSPKPVDFDHAFESLKNDASTAEMRLQARQNLSRSNREMLPKLSLIGIGATVVIFAAWPRATASRSWAQAVQSSTQARAMHTVCRAASGGIRLEAWRMDNCSEFPKL